MRNILNCGGGVNTVAESIWFSRNDAKLFTSMDVVFANTGSEMPETYDYLVKWFEPWLKKHGKSLITVGRPDSLEEYCLAEKDPEKKPTVPQKMWRWCTDKWKIVPIRKWADEHVGRPRTHYIGIAADERARATLTGDVEKVAYRYPLVEAGITRKNCEEIILSEGLPVPPKSGCFFCPMAPISHFVKLKQRHPDLWERTVRMEKRSMEAYPPVMKPVYGDRPHTWATDACDDDECDCPLPPVVGEKLVIQGTLKHKPIEDLVGLKDKQLDMFDELWDTGCASGQCFV